MKERLRTLIEHLNHGLVEREAAIKAALLAMLAGENMLLVGPPGTAKSLIARKLAKCLDEGTDSQAGKEYFEYLLTKFTTPEEIFGPLSISELKQDRFKRNTAGYLPSVRVAFLDEIFKASSSILNALLTILNERTYHNGTEALDVPLQALIAASNELPTGQEELEALYDRFLVRSFVDYVRAENMPRLLEKTAPPPTQLKLTANDIEAIRQAAEEVQLTDDVIAALQRIWGEHKRMFKEDRREKLSDRRLKKAVHLLRISAASNGRSEVDLSDILLLKDCLWNHPDNANKVRQMVKDTLRSFSRAVPRDAERDAQSEKALSTPLSTLAGKTGAVIKGYKGSGTEYDPILIATVHDLAGLERPDVGQQGYYFRQTADIDCGEISPWLNIVFTGHYDGGNYAIVNARPGAFLFVEALKASLKDLRLEGFGLLAKAKDSQILACHSDCSLVSFADNCRITACSAGEALVSGVATDCDITRCKASGSIVNDRVVKSRISQCVSGGFLVFKEVSSSVVRDCQVQLAVPCEFSPDDFPVVRVNGERVFCVGGICRLLSDGAVVENCFVCGELVINLTGFVSGSVEFSGISDKYEDSAIRNCALGTLVKELGVGLTGYGKRIARDGWGELNNNVALDCHSGSSDPDGLDGKSLSSVLFTQRYFENTLGWDFDTVWQWNDKLNQPELKSVGSKAQPMTSRHGALASEQGDLLEQQLSANIWL